MDRWADVVANLRAMQKKVQSLDEFLGERGLSSPISDFMDDKLRIPHGLTQRQEKQLHKEADAAMNEYHKKRNAAIDEYNAKVSSGEIRKPSIVERLLKTAHGHSDNESVQAARRVLKKRGYDWKTGKRAK